MRSRCIIAGPICSVACFSTICGVQRACMGSTAASSSWARAAVRDAMDEDGDRRSPGVMSTSGERVAHVMCLTTLPHRRPAQVWIRQGGDPHHPATSTARAYFRALRLEARRSSCSHRREERQPRSSSARLRAWLLRMGVASAQDLAGPRPGQADRAVADLGLVRAGLGRATGRTRSSAQLQGGKDGEILASRSPRLLPGDQGPPGAVSSGDPGLGRAVPGDRSLLVARLPAAPRPPVACPGRRCTPVRRRGAAGQALSPLLRNLAAAMAAYPAQGRGDQAGVRLHPSPAPTGPAACGTSPARRRSPSITRGRPPPRARPFLGRSLSITPPHAAAKRRWRLWSGGGSGPCALVEPALGRLAHPAVDRGADPPRLVAGPARRQELARQQGVLERDPPVGMDQADAHHQRLEVADHGPGRERRLERGEGRQERPVVLGQGDRGSRRARRAPARRRRPRRPRAGSPAPGAARGPSRAGRRRRAGRSGRPGRGGRSRPGAAPRALAVLPARGQDGEPPGARPALRAAK